MIQNCEIGEMVPQKDIDSLNAYIAKHGEEAFINAVWNGLFTEVGYAYIHPHDDMRQTNNFRLIQRAFINALI